MAWLLLTTLEVAFLQSSNKSFGSSVSVQQSSQFNLIDIKAAIVDWLKLERWSVCIFRNIENPRSASALEAGIVMSPIISCTVKEILADDLESIVD